MDSLANETVRIAFAYRPPAGSDATRVELLGETSDWRNGIALARQPDGTFARTIDLPVGVYQYKLLVDGTWRLDPENARTRSERGNANSVVAACGAPEPWLFAPSSPWIDPLERGGVRVLVGVRKPGAAPMLAFRDGDAPWAPATLAPAFEEDEHAFFVATVPASAQEVTFALEGDGARWETSWRRPRAAERAPAWWSRAALYTVFVDRFRPAIDRPSWEEDPGRLRAAGGDLDGIRRSLAELDDLGVDTLYLTPVHVGASVHRYDVVDPLTVDPALGGEEAYDALVRDAAARGMRVVQDVSFAHAGRGLPAYEDVLARGRASRFAPWFLWDGDRLRHYGKRTDAPLFDLENEDVQALALDAVAYWARRGAKGLRLDMTAEVPIALGRRIRRRFRDLVPDGVVLGEIVPRHAWRWREEGVVDASTDFGLHETVTDLVCNVHASAEEAFARLRRLELLRGGDPRATAVRFLSTHDHPRLATLAAHAGAIARLPLAYALLATLPGVPMLLYGEEVGMRSDGGGLELEDVWPDRAPMPWAAGRRDELLRSIVRALLRARRASEALRTGSLTLLFADRTTLVYRREADGDVVDVALSFDAEPKVLELADDELPRIAPLAQAGACAVDGAVVRLPAHGALVMRRERTLGRAVPPPIARRNLALRDRELALGAARVTSRPSRFFFAVTERCNLRCAHCITRAPELTASGAARTMTPAVLDALSDDFALADYFAFVHGGESLTAPILFDVLDAIRRARGSETYVAHLLTNGLLLSPAVAERLVRAGVSSISVSLDGATAATNDAIRVGGRFDDVVRRLGDVLAWRAGERVDVRVGLSYVVLAQNLEETAAFVDLAAELGVDWVKLEEGVPVNAFAQRSLVAPREPAVRRAIDAAIARGRARGLVMVDHTIERAVWRCRLDDDPDTRAFLEADEFANRGPIHPCRTPWESACVEPDGSVRALDFFGPVLGNVLAAPLRELWNAPAAIEARERSRLARVCGPAGPVTCVSS